MERDGKFSDGDWIVHSLYGVGQVKGIEVKGISGEESEYYRIESADSIFWIPLDQMDGEAVRPLSSAEEIHQAISVLAQPAEAMSSNHKIRQSRIEEVQSRSRPRAIARLIRDLRAWQREKGGLNKSERSAFRTLRQRFADEWAIVAGIKPERAALQLDHLLDPGKPADGEAESGTTIESEAVTGDPPSPSLARTWSWWPKRETHKINR